MADSKLLRIERLLAKRVAAYRRSARMTQEELAERVGTAPETISRLERGVTIPSFATLAKISRALNVAPHEFFALPVRRTEKDDVLDALVRDLRQETADDIAMIHDIARRILGRKQSSRAKP